MMLGTPLLVCVALFATGAPPLAPPTTGAGRSPAATERGNAHAPDRTAGASGEGAGRVDSDAPPPTAPGDVSSRVHQRSLDPTVAGDPRSAPKPGCTPNADVDDPALVPIEVDSTLRDAAVPRVRLLEADRSRPGLLHVHDDGSAAMRAARGRVTVERFPLPDGRLVELELERFEVLAPRAAMVVGRRQLPLNFDRDRVALYRGRIDGDPRTRAYIAVSDLGIVGSVDLGPGRSRLVLGSPERDHRGLARGPLVYFEAGGLGGPLSVEPCRVLGQPRPNGGVAAEPGPPTIRRIEVAVDSDYEFFTLFDDLDSAAAYVIALYGAVTDVYLDELQARVSVSYLRLWDQPDDLYNEPDPLGPFVQEWNASQGGVQRDVAQLLTGRRNLPYGGVAYLSSLCSDSGYSVNGYLNGAFADPSHPDPGNWDLVVVAHELGHNCGTLHTHDYGLDGCAFGEVRRAGIMSYCHTVSGGVSNVDMRFETPLRGYVGEFLATAACVGADCDGNGIEDAIDIADGTYADANKDGVPDVCQDCDGNGLLDPVEIATGRALDLDGNGRPDACDPDCNGNGIPDAADIASGFSADIYLNGIPDECEADCDGNGTSDYVQIVADMSLDVDRNAELDGCQDCDANGVNDFAELDDGLSVWVGSSSIASMRLFHPRSGAPVRFGAANSTGLHDLVLGVDGAVLGSLSGAGAIGRFDAHSGDFLGMLVPSGTGGLASPAGLLVTTEGRLLVASTGSSRVLEFDALSGAFIRTFADLGFQALGAPIGLAASPAGTIAVGTSTDRVVELDVKSGAVLRTIVPPGSGGLAGPRGVLVLPDGTLLVASFGSNALLRYDYATGAFLGRWDRGGNFNGFWGLRKPWSLRLDATGTRVLATSNAGSTAVHAYDAETGLFLRSFYVLADDQPSPSALLVLPPSPFDCNRNALLDACDIASGRSQDRNRNGVPDECEGIVGNPADLDSNGVVNGSDLGLLLGAWGECLGCPADINGDGVVDGADVGLLLGAWK
ncbi:MAG: hypothetical protein KDA22_01090 [Phycisphaerales bacterium]|nr:hypothetical protein [Phycisphaerales bacterium]